MYMPYHCCVNVWDGICLNDSFIRRIGFILICSLLFGQALNMSTVCTTYVLLRKCRFCYKMQMDWSHERNAVIITLSCALCYHHPALFYPIFWWDCVSIQIAIRRVGAIHWGGRAEGSIFSIWRSESRCNSVLGLSLTWALHVNTYMYTFLQ